MRYGMRKPSWKKSLSARTKGKRKKTIKRIFFEKTSLKIWWNQKIVVPLHPLKKTKL